MSFYEKTKIKNQKTKINRYSAFEMANGEYARFQDFHFWMPYQFLLLCKLMNTTPKDVLLNFMDTLDCGSWKREETSNKARQLLMDYFIECGYGKDFYTVEDRRKMFEEMNAAGIVWPQNAKMKLIDLHSKWRDKYHTY
jgi:hypothetical protein